MPCWLGCILSFWWIWGIGAIAAAILGASGTLQYIFQTFNLGEGPTGLQGALLAGGVWLSVWILALLIFCVIRCGGFV